MSTEHIQIPDSMHFGKVVATVGPASESREGVIGLAEAGVDVFRLNFSHGSHQEQGQRAVHIRDFEKKSGRPFGIVADMQGPKLRIGTFAGDKEDVGIVLQAGQSFVFHLKEYAGDEQGVSLMHPEVFKVAEVGMDILIDDGRLQFRVDAASDDTLETTVVTGGKLTQKKGVNIPRIELPIDAITEKDKKDMAFALSKGVDWIALSFVQRPEDVRQAREIIGDAAGIIAKIEKPSAVTHIEEIVAEVDAIMVARGDLGVEIPPEEVPNVQKRIINLCRQVGKPVIVATHMLDSMINSPRPTRAEVSDVANAIYDGSDAVMLSAETAAGDYPTESAAMMRRIVRRAVADSGFLAVNTKVDLTAAKCDTDSTVAAAQKAAQGKKPTAVVVAAFSFEHVMCYARKRYRHPLIAVTADQHLARRLALVWGVYPVYVQDAAILEGGQESLTAVANNLGIAADMDVQVIAVA